MNDTGDWSEWAIGTLRRMWAAGDTGIAIGLAVRRTKNSVIGRVHRMGLAPRPSPIKPNGTGEPRATQAAREAERQRRRAATLAAHSGPIEDAAVVPVPDVAPVAAPLDVPSGQSRSDRPSQSRSDRPSQSRSDRPRTQASVATYSTPRLPCLTLDDGCRWPLWDGAPQRGQPMPFCDAPRRSRSCSFCERHAGQAFEKPALSQRQRDRLARIHG